MKKRIPIGVDDFKEIRDEGYYFVDKSELISDILSERNKVYLFTRPRRFGKSLNLSMLDAFFNLKYPKDNKWFDGLKVSDCKECQEHKNAYPVIHFDFKDLSVSSREMFFDKLSDSMSKFYDSNRYLLDMEDISDREREMFNLTICGKLNLAQLTGALKDLSDLMSRYHGKKVIVLIDEYDNPINNSFGKSHQNEIIQTIREILSPLLKGNTNLEFAVITGVMQIAKESIFSGLNNITVNNIFSKKFDERYGFTEDEVKTLCKEYDHPEKFEEAKEWYDGYRFGDAEIYNPWSVLKYISEDFSPAPYWGGTSDNKIIYTLLENAGDEIWGEMRRLADGDSIKYNPVPTITLHDIGADKRDVYSVMAMSGYMSVETDDTGDKWISIPNGEMFKVFGEIILRGVDSILETNVSSFTRHLISGNVPSMESALYDLFASSAGNAMLNDEHSYQAFITGMLMYINGKYIVKADFEEGNGRYDIRLVPRIVGHPNIVMEIKRPNTNISNDMAENVAKKALEQIKDRDYIHGLSGDTILYGIAFRNKIPTIVSERIML